MEAITWSMSGAALVVAIIALVLAVRGARRGR